MKRLSTITTDLIVLFFFLAQAVEGQVFDVSECGKTKGCWIPDDSLCYGGCSGMGVSYRILNDSFIGLELFFESSSSSGVYVAVGFSDDYFMGSESVIECSSIANEPVSMKFSYNGRYDDPEDNTNSRIDSNLYKNSNLGSYFTESVAKYENGTIYCKSTVKVSGLQGNDQVFKYDPATSYFLLLVNGKTSSGGLTHHDHDSTSPATYLHDLNIGLNKLHCGHEKGCAMPDACNGLGVSYKVVDDATIEFEIFGPVDSQTNVYAAVGFSNDAMMGNESVLECSMLSNQPLSMKLSYNNPRVGNQGPTNVRIDNEQTFRASYITNHRAFIQDNNLYCSATVKVSGNADPRVFKYNPLQPYYLLLASGKTNDAGLLVHAQKCVDSTAPVYLNQPQPFFDRSECEKSKACYIPDDCPEGCDAMIASYKFVGENQMLVELTARQTRQNRYVALGFSTNGRMGNASVIECSSMNGSLYSMKFSYNMVTDTSKTNLRVTSDVSSFISNQKVQIVDGNLYCSAVFNVAGHPTDPTVFKYDANQIYYLIIAEGPTAENTLNYHDMKAISSGRRLADVNPTPPPPPADNGSFDGTDCGTKKACFLPDGLAKFGVAYRLTSPTTMDLEMMLVSPTAQDVYIGLGFSNNGKMPNSDVIECSALSGQELSMKFSYNDNSPKNVRIPDEPTIRAQNIQNFQSSYHDGQVYCRATVNINGYGGNGEIFKYDSGTTYQLLLATGPTSGVGLLQHTTTKVSSSRKLDDVTAGSGAASASKLIIAHAILMVLAWFLFVPTAVLFARVLRSCWPTKKPMGLLIWFHVHRTSNLLAIAMMIAAFVLVLCDKDWKWAKPASSWGGKHAIIGLTALILAWLQPFISTLRCTPDNPRRPLFNYIHRAIGLVAITLATTAIAIASMHFTEKNHGVQLTLALVPIVVVLAVSVVFIIYDKFAEVNPRNIEKIRVFRQGVVYAALLLLLGVSIALEMFLVFRDLSFGHQPFLATTSSWKAKGPARLPQMCF
ncbi:unnamed protein product [Caenorhabditis auriculariae]|uniref:Cytochrome b561 domain-containing protein n=1 Tax=Caenorhabditis auriculariae TaxID=2777116 RepID=A0A8S1HFD6_9PELO|nr:unnamed protein product [Caenorhabditis auriculariae]